MFRGRTLGGTIEDEPLGSSEQTSFRSKALDKVAEQIPRDSPFFPLYTSNAGLSDVLHMEPQDLQNPPDFSTSLKVLQHMTGRTNVQIERMAGMDPNSGFMSRVTNHSGKRISSAPDSSDIVRINFYEDTRYPPTTPRALLGMARPLREGEIERLSIDTDSEEGNLRSNGRIAIVFYDTQTGDLLLPRSEPKDRRIRKPLELSSDQEYLLGGGSASTNIQYLSRILRNRFDFLTKADGRQEDRLLRLSHDPQLKKRRGDVLRRDDLSLELGTKLGTKLRQISPPLGVTPIYLVNPPRRDEVLRGDESLKTHVRRIYAK